jgi:hypothetical protein
MMAEVVMAIYVTGDTHGTLDVDRFVKMRGILREDDYLIVLGDFGICWDAGAGDDMTRRFWGQQTCNVLFLDGNHENFGLLNHCRVSERFGGKVQEVGKWATHLMRGQVYEIEGKTFFAMGGAPSTDCGGPMDAIISAHLDDYFTHNFRAEYRNLPKHQQGACRVPGRSWWPEEIPSPKEIAEAKANLAAHGNKVDYILTHTASSRIYRHRGYDPNERPWGAPLIAFFDWVEENVQFKHWWFGHMHSDFVYDEKHIGFYEGFREAM